MTKPISKKILLYVMLAFVALSFSTSELFAVELFGLSFSAFQISLSVLAVLIIIQIIREKKLKLPDSIISRYALAFYLIWFIWALASVLWACDLHAWARSLSRVATYSFAAFAACYVLKDMRSIEKVLITIQIMVALHSLVGWYEAISQNHLFVTNPSETFMYVGTVNTNLPVSTLGIGGFTSLMVLGFFVSYSCFNIYTSTIKKYMCIALMLSCFAFVVMSKSFENMTGLFIALCVMSALSLKRTKWGLPLTAVVSISTAPALVFSLFDKLSSLIHMNAHNFDSVRAALLRNSGIILDNSCYFGIGAGQAEYYLRHYSLYDTTFICGLGAFPIYDMHNLWAEMLMCYGVIVFLAYVAMYVLLMWSLMKSYLRTNNTILLAAFCFLTANILCCTSTINELLCDWKFVVIAVILAYQGLMYQAAPKRPTRISSEPITKIAA